MMEHDWKSWQSKYFFDFCKNNIYSIKLRKKMLIEEKKFPCPFLPNPFYNFLKVQLKYKNGAENDIHFISYVIWEVQRVENTDVSERSPSS